MLGIDAVITKHFEMLFGDVDNKSLNEIESRNRFNNGFVIFVPCVMKGYIFAIIVINTGSGNNGSFELSADIFNGDVRSTKIRLCTNIKTISMFGIHFVFNTTEGRTEPSSKFVKEDFAKSITKKSIIKMFYRSPGSDAACATFGDKGMNMGIPL